MRQAAANTAVLAQKRRSPSSGIKVLPTYDALTSCVTSEPSAACIVGDVGKRAAISIRALWFNDEVRTKPGRDNPVDQLARQVRRFSSTSGVALQRRQNASRVTAVLRDRRHRIPLVYGIRSAATTSVVRRLIDRDQCRRANGYRAPFRASRAVVPQGPA